MTTTQPIEQERKIKRQASTNFFLRIQKQEQQNSEYKQKIIKLIKKKVPQCLIKQQEQYLRTNRQKNKRNNQQLSSQDQLQDLSPFYQRYMNDTPSLQNRNKKQKVQPSQQQLCQILKLIKQKNKKTSIQLMIKMLHQLIIPNYQNQPPKQNHSTFQTQKSQKSFKSNQNSKENRFKKYQIRFQDYKERIKLNYLANIKLQNTQNQVKTQDNTSQINQNPKLFYQRFIQFSTPYHIVEYFKYKNSKAYKKILDKQPYQARQQLLALFNLKGHISPDYNHQRKTAKIFCLVGPGIKAARPFFGQDLGSHTHSRMIAYIVKIAYRNFEQFINQNIPNYFKSCNSSDITNSQTQSQKSQGTDYPVYYASRRQLSRIKTPLFNCRNWMNDSELELFFMFVKKSYRINYPKEWQRQKIRQIFLLFGRVIKKLMERDILIRNLAVLKGDDVMNNSADKQFFGVSPENEVIRLTKRQKYKLERQKMKIQKEKQKSLLRNLSKVESRKQLFKKKYQKFATTFQGNNQSGDDDE